MGFLCLKGALIRVYVRFSIHINAYFKPRLNTVGIKEYKGQEIELISECEDEYRPT